MERAGSVGTALAGMSVESVERLAGLGPGESRSVALNHSVDRLDCLAEPAEYLAGFRFQAVECRADTV